MNASITKFGCGRSDESEDRPRLPGPSRSSIDRAREGTLLAEIDGRGEARRFVESLVA
jgi:hypothetical protein